MQRNITKYHYKYINISLDMFLFKTVSWIARLGFNPVAWCLSVHTNAVQAANISPLDKRQFHTKHCQFSSLIQDGGLADKYEEDEAAPKNVDAINDP